MENELEKYLRWTWGQQQFVEFRESMERKYSFETFSLELGKFFQDELDNDTGNAKIFRSETNSAD